MHCCHSFVIFERDWKKKKLGNMQRVIKRVRRQRMIAHAAIEGITF